MRVIKWSKYKMKWHLNQNNRSLWSYSYWQWSIDWPWQSKAFFFLLHSMCWFFPPHPVMKRAISALDHLPEATAVAIVFQKRKQNRRSCHHWSITENRFILTCLLHISLHRIPRLFIFHWKMWSEELETVFSSSFMCDMTVIQFMQYF